MELLNTVLFWIAFYLLAWNAYILFFNRCVPNIPTIRPIRRKIIGLLCKEIEARPDSRPFKIYDLGSGNGVIARDMARELPEAEVTGLEISRLALAHSRLKQRLFPVHNCRFLHRDYFEADLSDADAVVIFGMSYVMRKLQDKLPRELAPGTLIISNKFPFGPEWEPVEVYEVKSFAPHQKMLYIYRV